MNWWKYQGNADEVCSTCIKAKLMRQFCTGGFIKVNLMRHNLTDMK